MLFIQVSAAQNKGLQKSLQKIRLQDQVNISKNLLLKTLIQRFKVKIVYLVVHKEDLLVTHKLNKSQVQEPTLRI